MPFNFWGMVFDPLGKGVEVAVSLISKTSEEEVKWLVERLQAEWPSKLAKEPLSISDVSILSGEDLLVEASSSVPGESEKVETFPIYLDNNLFGIIGIVVPISVDFTDECRQFVKVMSHHLGMHLKKNYLMMANQELEFQDKLTGLFNQRHFYYLLEREFERSVRYNVPFSLLFVDIDHFKDINDTYGYDEGDNILREISRIILDNHRSTDLVSRYSGERFVLALPETHLREAEMVANRLRRLIAGHTFYIASENIFIKVTASIGVASFIDHRPRSVAQFIEFADTALYFAKRGGRNQVITYTYVLNMMMKDTETQG
jgi:diguanylate cyclase (GGDEF)-like protein